MDPALDVQSVILWQRCQAKSLWEDEVLGSRRGPGSKDATAPNKRTSPSSSVDLRLSHRRVTHRLACLAPWILLEGGGVVLACDSHSQLVS